MGAAEAGMGTVVSVVFATALVLVIIPAGEGDEAAGVEGAGVAATVAGAAAGPFIRDEKSPGSAADMTGWLLAKLAGTTWALFWAPAGAPEADFRTAPSLLATMSKSEQIEYISTPVTVPVQFHTQKTESKSPAFRLDGTAKFCWQGKSLTPCGMGFAALRCW